MQSSLMMRRSTSTRPSWYASKNSLQSSRISYSVISSVIALAALARDRNCVVSRYSNSFEILPSRTSATRQADSGTSVPSWVTTWVVYWTTKPSSKVLMLRSL